MTLGKRDFPIGMFDRPHAEESLEFFNQNVLPAVKERYQNHPELARMLANYFVLTDEFYQRFVHRGQRYMGVFAAADARRKQ